MVDVLAWNGCDLDDCTAECRLTFWVQSKMAELSAVPGAEHGLVALPFAPCTPGEVACSRVALVLGQGIVLLLEL